MIMRIYREEGVSGVYTRILNRLTPLNIFRQKFGKSTVTSKYNVVMHKNWLDATFRYCIAGTYSNFFSNYLRSEESGFVFLDIGANQGLFTLIASQNENCVRVIAFEPVSSTFALLSKNIKINGAAEKCFAFKKALGEKAGDLKIKIPINHSGAATTRLDLSGNFTSYSEEQIEIESSEFLNSLDLYGNHPIICKIDVEGNEEGVMMALIRSQIFGQIRAIFYEVDERWVDPKMIEARLATLGFSEFQKVGYGVHYDVLASRRI